jgi:hypothetical protein
MLARPKTADSSTVWLVTSTGDLPDEFEQRDHQAAADAWSDYWGRILELEIGGFRRYGEEAPKYGRLWASTLFRGVEQMSVVIERTA